MNSEFERAVAAATSKLLQKHLWAVFSRPTKTLEEMQPHIGRHLEFVARLSADGCLFAAGPFLTRDGEATGEGMFILRADEVAEAETIAAADPFHQAGVRSFDVRKWVCNVGWIGLELNYATRTFELK